MWLLLFSRHRAISPTPALAAVVVPLVAAEDTPVRTLWWKIGAFLSVFAPPPLVIIALALLSFFGWHRT